MTICLKACPTLQVGLEQNNYLDMQESYHVGYLLKIRGPYISICAFKFKVLY